MIAEATKLLNARDVPRDIDQTVYTSVRVSCLHQMSRV